MKLPKLYRVVWLEIGWLTDTCEGGEHVQRSGTKYVPARLVMDGGAKRWQVLDPEYLDNSDYFDEWGLYYEWYSYDLHLKEVTDMYRHDPEIARRSIPIKEQKRLKKEWEDWKNSKSFPFPF